MDSAVDEVLVELKGDRLRAAALARGELIEVVSERLQAPGAAGSLYLGRVVRGVPGLRGAFLEIGLDRPALLDANGPLPREGETLPVQIIEPASGDKAARVSRRLALEGRYAILLPGGKGVAVSRRVGSDATRRRLHDEAAALRSPGEGLILRSAAAGAAMDLVASDVASLRAIWAALKPRLTAATPPACLLDNADGIARLLRRFIGGKAPRFVFDDPAPALRARALAERQFGLALDVEVEATPGALFDRHGVAEVLGTTDVPVVRLPAGGRIIIETTAALTSIDVDVAQGVDLGREAPLRTDLEAAAEIGRQVRLRDLGGLIVVDFVRLKDKPLRARVEAALRRAVARDRAGVQLLGWTAAGLFEMIRPRARAVAALD